MTDTKTKNENDIIAIGVFTTKDLFQIRDALLRSKESYEAMDDRLGYEEGYQRVVKLEAKLENLMTIMRDYNLHSKAIAELIISERK